MSGFTTVFPFSSYQPRRGLAVIQGGGEREPRFQALQEKERPLRERVASMSRDELWRTPLLSQNTKTTVSLDWSIGSSCRPTSLCAELCYAAENSGWWSHVLLARLKRQRLIWEFSLDELLVKLEREFGAARRRAARLGMKLDFLRVSGSGDLTQASMMLTSMFLEAHPEVSVWVVTRKPELGVKLPARPNLYLQISLDASTREELVWMAESVVRNHERAYLSFLRTTSDEATKGAAITFPVKRGGLAWMTTDCPADAKRMPLKDACATCRKCFRPATLRRQRKLRPDLVLLNRTTRQPSSKGAKSALRSGL